MSDELECALGDMGHISNNVSGYQPTRRHGIRGIVSISVDSVSV